MAPEPGAEAAPYPYGRSTVLATASEGLERALEAAEEPRAGATTPPGPPAAAGAAAKGPRPPSGTKRVVRKKKRRGFPISVNLANCKYELLRIVQKKLGWKEVGDDDEWQVYWTDTSVNIERIMKLTKTQKINHFTGMLEICRKKSLARNINRISAMFGSEFDFTPKTFVLPGDMPEFLSQFAGKKRKTFILKPDAGCQGKGIALAQDAETALSALESLGTDNVVAQRYLPKPFLIDGYKFDLRVYVLVISCDPLRVFLYNDGLARFCTEKYSAPRSENLADVCMHLTNYAVNKHNEKFAFNEDAKANDEGSKWSIQGLRDWMNANGHDFDTAWDRIADLTVKTLCTIQPILQHNYRSVLPPEHNDGFSCFEVLGLDVLLDHTLKPWLIEVNHSPSFTVDTPLDLAIKEDLISDTIDLVRVDPRAIKKAKQADKQDAMNRLYGAGSKKDGSGDDEAPRRKGPRTEEEIEAARAAAHKTREKYEEKHMGGFERIYPSADAARNAKYQAIINGAKKVFQSHSFQHRVRNTLEKVKEQARHKADEEAVLKARQAGDLKAARAKEKELRGTGGRGSEKEAAAAAGGDRTGTPPATGPVRAKKVQRPQAGSGAAVAPRVTPPSGRLLSGRDRAQQLSSKTSLPAPHGADEDRARALQRPYGVVMRAGGIGSGGAAVKPLPFSGVGVTIAARYDLEVGASAVPVGARPRSVDSARARLRGASWHGTEDAGGLSPASRRSMEAGLTERRASALDEKIVMDDRAHALLTRALQGRAVADELPQRVVSGLVGSGPGGASRNSIGNPSHMDAAATSTTRVVSSFPGNGLVLKPGAARQSAGAAAAARASHGFLSIKGLHHHKADNVRQYY